MPIDKDNYVDHVLQVSLVLVSVSLAYFFDPTNLWTLVFFLPIAVLFGHTAYISTEKFQLSSLYSAFAVVFATITYLAPIALFIALTNPFLSLISSGSGFKDFYKSVSLPMLLSGFLIGALVYGAAIHDPEIQQGIEDGVTGFVSSTSEEVVEETGVVETQENANRQMIEATTTSSIALTQGIVLNETESLDEEQRIELLDSFRQAQEEVPERLIEESEDQHEGLDISERAADSVENFIDRDKLVFLIPIIGLGLYSLHPVVGILTAIAGTIFLRIGGKRSET